MAKTQDIDMAATDGGNDNSRLLQRSESQDMNWSSNPANTSSTAHSPADHKGSSKYEEAPAHSTVGFQQRNEVQAEEETRRLMEKNQFQTEEEARQPMNKIQSQTEEETRRQTNNNVPPRDHLDREQALSRNDIANLNHQLRHAHDQIRHLSNSEANLQNRLRQSEIDMDYLVKKANAEISKARDSHTNYRPLLRAKDDEISLLKSSLARYKNDLGDLEALYSKISESGSYQDNTATPTDASDAFNKLSLAIDSFSKQLGKVVSSNPAKLEELRSSYGDVTFLRPSSHFPALPLKAEVVKILFEGFENESFGLEGGYSVYPDPARRKKEFFALFLDFRNNKRGPGSVSRGEQDDDQFVKYYNRIKPRVWQLFNVENSEDGPQGLDVAFMKAAQSVWAVHLLSFSFEPPASLFRIRSGAQFDRAYMATPAFLEFNEDSLEKVAFMLTPGLRVDKFSTLKSEIYPVKVEK